MFDDWKQAWRQAVENFQREAGVEGAPPRLRALERELISVRGALLRLDDEISQTARTLARERDEEQICLRRGRMARGVGDDETVRIAEEFATRHAERAGVLDRKLGVLQEERALLARDLEAMRTKLAELSAGTDTVTGAPRASGVGSGARSDDIPERDTADDVEFSRLERERRERAANERLEELKRRMRG
jgi:aryl-alcohol dehydrogenase-like predicted oxidoreductase